MPKVFIWMLLDGLRIMVLYWLSKTWEKELKFNGLTLKDNSVSITGMLLLFKAMALLLSRVSLKGTFTISNVNPLYVVSNSGSPNWSNKSFVEVKPASGLHPKIKKSSSFWLF